MKTIRILLADDHQIILDGLSSFLEKEDEIEVVAMAKNGKEVLEILEEQVVDIAILDVNMSEMNGLETANRIIERHTKTKVLFLTMLGESDFVIHALRVGAHGYVLKEKSKEYLVGAIHAIYRGARYWSPEILARISEGNFHRIKPEEVVRFTRREQEVLCILLNNPSYTSEDIGADIGIVAVTVDTHIRNMKAKIKAKRRQELISYAVKNKLCE